MPFQPLDGFAQLPEPVVGQVTLGRGSLYRFQAGNASVRGSEHMDVEKVLSPVDISNGIAWNDIETLMYYIDTPSGRIDVFDFDPDKGTICKLTQGACWVGNARAALRAVSLLAYPVRGSPADACLLGCLQPTAGPRST